MSSALSPLSSSTQSFSCRERIQAWCAENPTVHKVIVVCALILLIGISGFGLLSLGAPLGMVLVYVGIELLAACLGGLIPEKPLTSQTFSKILEPPEHNAPIEDTTTKDFSRLLQILGPERFKEKLEKEVPSDRDPSTLYFRICRKLSEVNAPDSFYGPLPRLKQFFREQWRGVPCSEFASKALIPDKNFISYHVKSQILSPDEGKLLMRSYELNDRYDGLEARMRRTSLFYPSSIENEVGPIIDRHLTKIQEERRAAFAKLDAEFEQVRGRPF